MNILVITYDLPLEEQKEAYEEYVRTTSLPGLMQQPGLVELRVYDNPLRTTPHIMVLYEFDSAESAAQFAGSSHYREAMYRLRGFGCQNITARLWKPGVPASMRPSDA